MNRSPRAPGDFARRRAEMIRVDHAGEFGAVQIYRGQRAVFDRIQGKAKTAALIAEMEAGEQTHLATFDTMLRDQNVRPTAMAPLWRFAGFSLGAVTALMGEKAAHACTVAVEEVIEQHYAAQAEELGQDDTVLRDTIVRFREDELGHKDTALSEGAREAPGYEFLSAAIRIGCRAAIAVSEKI